ncbi:PadR family transcriptional regulator [Ruoffia tabacinasalis]|uniref:PadR family transcriptional regulator n=1 Tax=Ruoffia tabacinasalis TaxID=87458 RepID=A0A5R9DSJ5_9LACT|nr:helix-turn-helix transcriptional regulator [Ruoffia tabacinasalis]TLQ38495.1 PadR family transcriptional regulator [Ruoffia tabacinasalis]
MMRNSALPLTETTYLILLSLLEPLHGYAIIKNVEELSDNHVKIAAGTMYGALDNLYNQAWIEEVASENKRRKVYQITEKGKEVLEAEIGRLSNLTALGYRLFN